MKYSCDDDNDASVLQNTEIDEEIINGNNEASENIEECVEGNEIKAGPFTIEIPPMRNEEKDEERTVQCTLCPESFFYELGLRTHMEHAHINAEPDEASIHAKKLERQQQVLSTIPKKTPKKRKNAKK